MDNMLTLMRDLSQIFYYYYYYYLDMFLFISIAIIVGCYWE